LSHVIADFRFTYCRESANEYSARSASQQGAKAMRIKSEFVVYSAVALAIVGLGIAAFNTPLSATGIDAASAVRGSVGVSLTDLDLGSRIGELWISLNGCFALLFIAGAALAVGWRRRAKRTAHGATRRQPRESGRLVAH
jgi:hypothetical protein